MSDQGNLTATRFVRGGQSTQHWFRMAGQVFTTFTISWLIVFAATWSFLLWQNFTMAEIRFSWVDFIVRYIHRPLGNMDYPINTHGLEWIPEGITAGEYLASPELLARVEEMVARGWYLCWISNIPGALAGVLIVFVYARSGKNLGQTKHQRGSKLVSQQELLKWSKQKWKKFRKDRGEDAGGPEYTIAGIPFPPEHVMAQTGIYGTTGVGKTVAITELLQTIRREKGRAIIYDRMGALVEKFYDPDRGDKIVNPFDARSVAWSPFYEATDIASFAQMAEVLIPIKADAPDPFWQTSARLLFENTARKLFERGDGTNLSLREAIALMPDEELIDLVANTPSAQLMNEKNPKTASSIRTNLITELRFFEYLRDDGERFSIRDWVKDESIEEGFIFLTGDSEHAAATRNVISACLEIASNALMTGQSGVDYPKMWFIVDELPTLNRLPFIEKSLAEIRQFGGAYVLGFQVYSQLEGVYGENGAETIAGNLNNRIIFNNPDAKTAEKSARSLGMEDVVDQRHNITMGAHATRDGVGYSEQRIERYIATPSEIQSLPKLNAYLRFGYEAPAAKVRFTPITVKRDGPPVRGFVEYDGEGFAEGSLKLRKPEKGDGPAVPVSIKRFPRNEFDDAGRMQVFEEWKHHWRQQGVETGATAVFHEDDSYPASEEYISAYWDQKFGWDHFFESYVLGEKPEDIDPRIEMQRISPELRQTLERVMPAWPVKKPRTLEDGEVKEEAEEEAQAGTDNLPPRDNARAEARPAPSVSDASEGNAENTETAQADPATPTQENAPGPTQAASPEAEPVSSDHDATPETRRVSKQIKASIATEMFHVSTSDLLSLRKDKS